MESSVTEGTPSAQLIGYMKPCYFRAVSKLWTQLSAKVDRAICLLSLIEHPVGRLW